MEKSCGTVPYTVKNGTLYYLLVRVGEDGPCGFPKGHVESGETEEETALRETWEETSVKPVINSDFRYEMTYRMGNGNEKKVVFFAADFSGQTPSHNEGFEKFDYLILPFEEACNMLTFESTRKMLESANDFIATVI